jgi:hypothetical protein
MPTNGMSDGTGGPSSGEDGLGDDNIERSGDLEGLLVPWHHMHRQSEPFDKPCIVSCSGLIEVRGRVRGLQNLALEALWCLDRAKRGTIDRALDGAALVDSLDGVHDGQTGHDRRVTGTHRCYHGCDHLDRDQWSGSVVHEDDINVVRQREQGSCNRVLSGFAASNHKDLGEEGLLGKHRGNALGAVLRRRDDDQVDDPTCRQGTNRVHEHRDAAQWAQGLGNSWSEPAVRPVEDAFIRPPEEGVGGRGRLGRENLVEDGLSLVLVGLLR